MPPRRPTLPPPPEIKQFAPDEIEQGIRKLGRRIEEVQALDPGQVRRDDQRVRNVEQNIDTTILEVFGPNSPEYRRHHHHQIWHGPHVLFEMPPAEVQACFARGIPQTVTMLEGLIHVLEEKRVDFAGDTTTRVRAAFRGLDLHPRIAAVCADLYRDGHYRNAVLDASLALVNFVKEKSRCHDLDGAKLMREVFSPNSPVLAPAPAVVVPAPAYVLPPAYYPYPYPPVVAYGPPGYYGGSVVVWGRHGGGHRRHW